MTQPASGIAVGPNGLVAPAAAQPMQFRGTSVLSSPRFKELDRRQKYYDCTQHDHKRYDFDGRALTIGGSGALVSEATISSRPMPGFIPLRARRPSVPYRLPKIIVASFTNMVFGAQRFPSVRVEGDEDAQDFATQLVKSAALSTKMIRARNLGGAVGTVGISWCYDRKGRPRAEVHNGKFLYVHEWDDREELIPLIASEVYLERRADYWDSSRNRFIVQWFWRRRDWTPNEDILFAPVLYKSNVEPAWIPDPENSVTHNDGFCHLTWIQNLPTDDIDGLPDYEGLYEKFDQLDILTSVLVKGGVLNLDPTLVLKIDPDMAAAMGTARTGSDGALTVGIDGGAEFLELAGTALTAGTELFRELRRGALETAQCVVIDPTESMGPDVSGVAQRQKYGPMLGKCEILREQYGGALKRVLDQMIEVARLRAGRPITVYVQNPETGEDVAQQVVYTIALPPKAVKTPQVDATGAPVQDEEGKPTHDLTMVERNPGSGGELELMWPPYFPPTPQDIGTAATALTTASGGKAVLSQQSATEQMATFVGIEPDEEWDRVQKMTSSDADQAAAQAATFGGADGAAGGKVDGEKQLPPGASPKPPKFGGSKPPFGGGGAGGAAAGGQNDDTPL
jgi:hypothetical protein